MGISAPSLSYSIKKLEQVTGAALLVRKKTGVSLTPAGENLYNFCKKYFRDMDEMQSNLELNINLERKKVKVGTFQTLAIYFWPLLVDSIENKSEISISITTNRSAAILESLMKKEIDVALTVESIQNPHLIRHELFKDEYSFYISKKFKTDLLSDDDIRAQTLIYIPDAIDHTGKSLQQYKHLWGLMFKEEFELDSLEVVGEFVKKGYGVGILPNKVAQSLKAHIKPIQIKSCPEKKFGQHRFYLSYRNDLDLSQYLLNVILSAANKAVKQLNA